MANVGGRTNSVTIPITNTASVVYTSGNVVGGLLTFPGMFSLSQTGIIESSTLNCTSVQTGIGFILTLLNTPNASLIASTFADNTAPVINALDVPNVVGVVSFNSGSSPLVTHTVYNIPSIGLNVISGSQSLFGVLVCVGTPTFTTTNDITINLTALVD